MLSKKKCIRFSILKLRIIAPKEKLLAVNETKCKPCQPGFIYLAVSLSTAPLTKNKK